MLKRVERPIWFLRALIWATILLIIIISVTIVVYIIPYTTALSSWAEIIQTSEAGVTDLIFLAIALWFIASLESKAKRKAFLNSLHRLRSTAHVVDMHQLTKDPAQLLAMGTSFENKNTTSSLERSMSAYELSRYLDYCSDLLSLISKLAALHAQKENDGLILDAVNDVEQLANGLSAKIWQKLSMLDNDLLSKPNNSPEN